MTNYNDRASIAKAKKIHPELKTLHPKWKFRFDEQQRVYYYKDEYVTYHHPELGALPEPWCLKAIPSGDSWTVLYFNRKTEKITSINPRWDTESINNHAKQAPKELWITATSMRNNNKIDLDDMQRAEIQEVNIRPNFELVHTIDKGDGTLGAMNGGVFVVRMRTLPGKLFIEKRFKKEDREMATQEIKMLRLLNHPALTSYFGAFISPGPPRSPVEASVYIEFCDRGSLADIIKEYWVRRNDNPPPTIPESFIWHAFGGLLDALAYLKTGSGWLHNPRAKPKPRWVPILHRDIKPDNVLLRSRSTIGSKKYFYCILSDFGMACPDYPPEHKNCEINQKTGGMCGTPTYLAPELCHQPYATNPHEEWHFPQGQRHTPASDLWAVGAVIYNLALCETQYGTSHLAPAPDTPKLPRGRWESGREARIRTHPLKLKSEIFSDYLRALVENAAELEPQRRNEVTQFIRFFEQYQEESGYLTQASAVPLPYWATKKHEYFHKCETVPEKDR
ncbi:kinase-like domain-containing protein [Tricladium varicosporioides]|nr:kinase-like domain-containing protein [Hymenoscyphus varicosporioides]